MASSPDPSLSRRERERKRRRQAMLDAARAVFAEEGYADATLDEIAERAEFGKGTLYNYFEGGKEELFLAVFDEASQELEGLIRTVFHASPGGRPLRDTVHEFVVRYFEMVRDQQDLFLVLVKEVHTIAFSDETERVEFFEKQQERVLGTLVPVLREAMDQAEIRRLSPTLVANVLFTSLRSMGTHHILECDHAPTDGPAGAVRPLNNPDQAADALTTLLFDGLAVGDASSASA
ncbi:TetR/AcrR family transcriptional regulator [Salinibacter ruber]|uniref:AcrR family transcriptional regulator n=1 Tax=Salinibacter ruber TaxID=146919 RepID=A0AAW5P2Q3_9BACT|nr:TetR/AcrR family transcriptional regulator [Salinibacter ruber]MCS3662867.1 AcrR family transcriptional regulator [Salinibacter ruber]MCS4156198.1 AcrR family transcriptional regulator [Salinibacter ruber]MCS4222330.1 AcrR family transcriptional regulator [Salinibacter ruber]